MDLDELDKSRDRKFATGSSANFADNASGTGCLQSRTGSVDGPSNSVRCQESSSVAGHSSKTVSNINV